MIFAVRCGHQANTTLGSSNFWPPHPNADDKDYPDQFDLALTGMLGNDAGNHLQNWSSVFVMYCDGSSFTSNRPLPVVTPSTDGRAAKDTTLFYRGAAILDATLDSLASVGLQAASSVVLDVVPLVTIRSNWRKPLLARRSLRDERFVRASDFGAVHDFGAFPVYD